MEDWRFLDLFIHYLKLIDSNYVFGIPGGLILPFFDAVERDSQLKLIATQHEAAAGFMAGGYARISGKIGICAATSGPGATNLMTGVASCYSTHSPVLVITGQAWANVLGKGAGQECDPQKLDIVQMFKSITHYSVAITHPETLELHLRRALNLCWNGVRGPVHLNIPVNLWSQTVKAQPPTKNFLIPTYYYDPKQVEEIYAVLKSAKHPLMLAGSGIQCADSKKLLLHFAEMLGIKVVTTQQGKGVFQIIRYRSV